MSTTITGSANIAVLDSRIEADLCGGVFLVDVSPSTFISDGEENVLGVKVKITNPYGVVVKDYPTSTYDIDPPLTGESSFDIPTQAGNYQYGSYKFDVQITDADGTTYVVSKTLSICVPDPKYKTRNYGSLSAELRGVCRDGKLYVIADTVPTYKGVISDTQANDLRLEYPTKSGLPVLETELGVFSVQLFEGVYDLEGYICANYSIGDETYVKVNYKVKKIKSIRCLLDETCLDAALTNLYSTLNTDCTTKEKEETQAKIFEALFLIKLIEIHANAGSDASDSITRLEDILGCSCTCNCAEGAPIINQEPSTDVVVEGCNVESETVGLTTTYTINNYAYVVAIAPNGGAITISAPSLLDCTQAQTITFNLETLYAQIKGSIINSTEYNFWASIIKQALSGLDTTCLGISPTLYSSLSFAAFVQLFIDRTCTTTECEADLLIGSIFNEGADVTVTWSNENDDVYETNIYLDGILKGTVLSTIEIFVLEGAADGDPHTYTLVSKCSNGSIGNTYSSSFTFFGCPTIAKPTLSLTSVPEAECPYDISALVTALPAATTAEWHNLNSTNASSLVSDPENVADGTYWVFAKDTDGCYSLGVMVTIICTEATNCSAPQNLLVENIDDGFRVRFAGATFPPPSNSYTVKRRLTSDPDTGGSYTTIGTPTYNATVNRWEILDETGVDNTLYTYRAISNCATSAPYVDYIFANITCPTVTLTPGDTDVDYSFTNVGANITKYEVSIYESDGATLIHTDTILPVFASPITGTFLYLDAGTSYKVKVRGFIGTYYTDCGFSLVTTTGGNDWTISYTNNDDEVPIQLYYGNNGASPTTTELYNGLYTTDPLTGALPESPTVNANVLFFVDVSAPIVSITCNGVSGTPSGGNFVSWNNVNGSILINFTTS